MGMALSASLATLALAFRDKTLGWQAFDISVSLLIGNWDLGCMDRWYRWNKSKVWVVGDGLAFGFWEVWVDGQYRLDTPRCIHLVMFRDYCIGTCIRTLY